MIWKEEGMNHGKACYTAVGTSQEDASPTPASGEPSRKLHEQPAFLLAAGVALGAIAVLAIQRLS